MTGRAEAGKKLPNQPSSPEEIDALLRSFGANVRAARQAAGLTQVEVSKRSSIDQSEVSAIELGKANCTLRTVARLSTTLGISVQDLLKR